VRNVDNIAVTVVIAGRTHKGGGEHDGSVVTGQVIVSVTVGIGIVGCGIVVGCDIAVVRT